MKKDIFNICFVSFIFSFLFFIYEPICLYIGSINDFWFDFYTMLKCSLIAFSILFLVISIVLLCLYFVLKKFKKIKVFNCILIIFLSLFIITYIEGNYLSSSLPVLDGREINWNDYSLQKALSFALLVIITIVTILLIKKFKSENTIRYYKYVCLSIIVMLLVSLLPLCLNNQEIFKNEVYFTTATSKNINVYSEKENLIVFLLDSVDSKTMESVLQSNNDYLSIFDDFTYYPNTLSGYPFTDYNVPLLLSGKWYEEQEKFSDFYNKSMDDSPLLELLEENDYDANIYNVDFKYNTEKAKQIKNLDFSKNVDYFKLIKNEIRFDLYKYLPFYLKQTSKIEYLDFNATRKEKDIINNMYSDKNKVFYNEYLDLEMEKSDNNQFKYIHIEGAHAPYNMNENLEIIENGTNIDKIKACLTIIKKYLNYLKSNDVYDNSTIIIMADHGFWFDDEDEDLLRRSNPIMYIKGFDEHHERIVSDQIVSFGYFQDLYKNIIDGIKKDNLFDNINTNDPRRFLLYRTGNWDHLEEYLQYGYASDLSTMKKTGNEYDLKK